MVVRGISFENTRSFYSERDYNTLVNSTFLIKKYELFCSMKSLGLTVNASDLSYNTVKDLILIKSLVEEHQEKIGIKKVNHGQ